MNLRSDLLEDRAKQFCNALIDQAKARVIVKPQADESGFWFGGGNLCQSPDGDLYLVGRYRNAGDSRTGVAAGTRGLELAIFRSGDQGQTFQQVVSWDKPALNSAAGEVLSIEGSCLRFCDDGVELFVSTEKTGVPYPESVDGFLKPGAGVWNIDVLRAADVAALRGATPEVFLASSDPEHLHVKDPFWWPVNRNSHSHDLMLGFCSHPFNWSSSNTCRTALSSTDAAEFGVFPRGTTWDVAMTRGTCVLPMPELSTFAEGAAVSVLFYCGGECVRSLEEHGTAVRRPRGYSCEELGGAAVVVNGDVRHATRLSRLLPMFVSPTGTGCSRYVSVLRTDDGFYATWQQSQSDLSQPLVMNFLSHDAVAAIIAEA
ncbi:MAG: hypothetical protein KDA96_08760 [Planctomycetaceae bacterium]|nr:hypothetical protein [Planctomycetaceae bacterium]